MKSAVLFRVPSSARHALIDPASRSRHGLNARGEIAFHENFFEKNGEKDVFIVDIFHSESIVSTIATSTEIWTQKNIDKRHFFRSPRGTDGEESFVRLRIFMRRSIDGKFTP